MEWHDLSAEQALHVLKTDEKKGLDTGAAALRLSSHGKNILSAKRRRGIVIRFLSQFKDFMVLILLAAAAVSFGASLAAGDGDLVDPVMILFIVILNAVIGTVQESKAEKAIDELKKLSAPTASVLRSGKEMRIPSEDIVVGDILLLSSGDMVCADARLLKSNSLCVDESSLTGESVPSEKNADVILRRDLPPADRCNMVYASTFVTGGSARALVTATGMDTRIGSIARMLGEEKQPDTPLQRSLAKTGKVLGLCALALCGVIFILGIAAKTAVLDMFLISISLAVAAIPEGLPAVVTIVLALGVRALAARRAVVRSLPAVEALGRATVICSDKTGTLTKGRMSVTKLWSAGHEVSSDSSQGSRLLELFALCSNAKISGSRAVGMPTECALVEAADAAGKKREQLLVRYPKSGEQPFDSRKKYMVTYHRMPGGEWRTIVKGAPDVIIGMCGSTLTERGTVHMSAQERNIILAENERMASASMRMIAAAYCDSGTRPNEKAQPRDLIFCGLAGMTDPPRPRVREAVERCRMAGIKTVMITGDHIATAKAVARDIGIFHPGDRAISGAELEKLSDSELSHIIGGCSVFARVAPEHKVRIVKALRSKGELVAMTGDGVNDAPALRCADIGCAMGKGGTDVAKSASDIVLTDDNFATIVDAVEQGRGIFDNIRRSIHFLLSSNIGEILVVLCTCLMHLPSPLAAIQLLWVNLVTDSLPALALGAERTPDDIMERAPERSSGIFTRSRVMSIIVEGCFIGGLAFLAYSIGRVFFDVPGECRVGQTMTFAVLSMSQLFHAFNLRSEKSLFAAGITGNPLLLLSFAAGVIMQCSVISVPVLSDIFGTVPLSPVCWLIVAALSAFPLVIGELEKLLSRRSSSKHKPLSEHRQQLFLPS